MATRRSIARHRGTKPRERTKGGCAKSSNPVHNTFVTTRTVRPEGSGAQSSLLRLLAAAVGLTKSKGMTSGDRRSVDAAGAGTHRQSEATMPLLGSAAARRACAGQRFGLMAKPAQLVIL